MQKQQKSREMNRYLSPKGKRKVESVEHGEVNAGVGRYNML